MALVKTQGLTLGWLLCCATKSYELMSVGNSSFERIDAKNRVHVLVVFSKLCSLQRSLPLQTTLAFENDGENAKKRQFLGKRQFPIIRLSFRDSPGETGACRVILS